MCNLYNVKDNVPKKVTVTLCKIPLVFSENKSIIVYVRLRERKQGAKLLSVGSKKIKKSFKNPLTSQKPYDII